MKKIAAISSALFLIFFFSISCGKKAVGPKAGAASLKDMLSLIPDDSKGVVFVNFHRAMETEIVRKTIKEDKNYAKYQEFLEKTGIDIQKDIFFLAIAITEEMGLKKTGGAAVLNLKYNKPLLLTLIKAKAGEEQKELKEEDYNGIAVYTMNEKEKDVAFSFLDDSNIIAGSPNIVKSIIDVAQKKKENIFKNESLSELLEKTNRAAIIWSAVLISPEAIDKFKSENPMLSNLEGIKAASLYFDYKNRNIIAEIKVMSEDEAKNKQVAELLTGIKALGLMITKEKPVRGKLLEKIEITSGPEYVKIFIKVPEEMLNKLKQNLKEGKN